MNGDILAIFCDSFVTKTVKHNNSIWCNFSDILILYTSGEMMTYDFDVLGATFQSRLSYGVETFDCCSISMVQNINIFGIFEIWYIMFHSVWSVQFLLLFTKCVQNKWWNCLIDDDFGLKENKKNAS